MLWLKYSYEDLYHNMCLVLKQDLYTCYILQTFFFPETNLTFHQVLLDFSLTVKAATVIFISGRGSAISSAKEGKAGFIYNLVKS